MSEKQPAQRQQRLLQILDRFPAVRLALWGDLVVDEFIDGQVNRISREAPVLILDYLRSQHIPGGAANTAANIAAVGATVVPVGVVGDDASGRALLKALEQRGMDVSRIDVIPGLDTPTKSRVSGAGLHTTRQQIVRIDRGRPHDLPPAVRRRLAATAQEAATATKGLVVVDYGYETVDPVAVRRLARSLRPRRRLVAVDSRWRVLEFSGVTTVTPNEPELEAALGISLERSDGPALGQAGDELLRRLECRSVLVTRGSHGMAVFNRPGVRPVLIPVYGTDEVADVTGAGDTVMAVYAVALAAGARPPEAARLANYAGGLVVMKHGTATVSRQELHRAIQADS
jgi:rfaE bifunctional protein kinase chain/domain